MSQHHRPCRTLALTLAAVLPLTATLLVQTPDRLMWNASASLPIGLYWLRAPENIRVGTIVAIRPSGDAARLVYGRNYVGAGIPLMKKVAASAGDTVCRTGDRVRAGYIHARALKHDRIGRPLPSWQGCHRLGGQEVFLLNSRPDSLDGRYFGVTQASDIIARAEPVWTIGP
jgi:conjugative transfer signal peptidase TraF